MIVTSVFVVKSVKDFVVPKYIRDHLCRAITSLNDDNIVIDNTEQDAIENYFVTTNSNQDDFPFLKEGVKLPKSPED